MDLSRRLVLLLLGLLALATLGTALLASALLAGGASGAGGEAADLLLLLGASALLALLAGLGLAVLRLWLLRPLERTAARAARLLGASAAHGAGGEVAAIEAALARLEAERAAADRQSALQLDVLSAWRQAADEAGARLVLTDRLALVGQLALGAAHEAGSALTVALGALETMAEPGSEPSEGAVLRATAEQALLRVDARLREISSFARAPAAAESCDVVATASTTLGLARCHRRCRQVEMTLEAPAEGSARVAMPAAELEQVLLNLLVNAADAMGQRGRTTIRVAPAERDGWDLLVEDEGPGIPPEQRREVLRPFFTTKPPGEGTGLGLAVCERLVLGRGGSLLIDASASGGASIRVRLPALH